MAAALPDVQDVSSPVYLVELYLPSGMYRFAMRHVEVRPDIVASGDFGGTKVAPGLGRFGYGGFGDGGVATG